MLLASSAPVWFGQVSAQDGPADLRLIAVTPERVSGNGIRLEVTDDQAMRIKMLSHDLGSSADLAGAAFCAALAATVFRQPDRCAAAEQLRQMAENAGSDERGALLLAAVETLLSGALH